MVWGPHVVQVKVTAARAASTSTADDALAGLARRYDQGTTATDMDWEYLLLTARRAG